MEKTAVFGPVIIFFGFFAIMIIGFITLIAKLIKKAKNDQWKGVVTDKNQFEYEDDNDMKRDRYFLVVKTDSGKEKKVGLSKKMWNTFKVGDKIEKLKGFLYPQKQ